MEFFPLQLMSASPTDTAGLPLPFSPSVSVCLDDLFFSIFIFLSSAAPASSSTPVPLSHLDSEYHFHLPSPCRWLSASHSVSVWRDLLYRVIIPLCWWRAALGFRGANELRRRHRAPQIRWGAALPPGRGAWKALLWTENLAGRLPKAVAPPALSSRFVVS